MNPIHGENRTRHRCRRPSFLPFSAEQRKGGTRPAAHAAWVQTVASDALDCAGANARFVLASHSARFQRSRRWHRAAHQAARLSARTRPGFWCLCFCMNDFWMYYFWLDSVTATFLCCCILVSEHANLFLGIKILSYAGLWVMLLWLPCFCHLISFFSSY